MVQSAPNTVKELISSFEEFQSARSSLDQLYTTMSELLFPFDQQGEPRRKMWDSTAVSACIKLASLLHNLITPFGQRWHKLICNKKTRLVTEFADSTQKEVDKWCDEITDELFLEREKYSSGLNFCFKEFDLQIVRLGTGCFFVGADEDDRGKKSGIYYSSIPIQDVYVGVNHKNVIDTVFRRYPLTVANIAKKWGEDKLSDKMRSELTKNPSKTYEFVHAVYPRSLGYEEPDAMPRYHSKHVCVDESRMIDEGFYRAMPYIIGRYETHPKSAYGISPAMQALSAIRRLNELSEMVSVYASRSIDTPSIASDVVQRLPFSARAKAVNYGFLTKEGRPLIQPLPQNNNPVEVEHEMQRITSQIRELFFLDLFQILGERASRSATESMEKTREKGAFMSSLIGCLQSEVVASMVRRELDMIEDHRRLPTPPFEDISACDVLNIVCTSPLYRYQQADGVEGRIQADRYLVETAGMTGDERYRYYVTEATRVQNAKDLGLSSHNLRTKEEVDEIMQELNAKRDKQQQPSGGDIMDSQTKLAQTAIQLSGGQG